MGMNDLSEEIQNFIFEYVDSVELLEILLLMESNPSQPQSASTLSTELRSSRTSVEQRLQALWSMELIDEVPDTDTYVYRPADPSKAKVVQDLSQAYRTHRPMILNLIFSPVKRARDFANAFRRSGKPRTGKSDG